MQTLVTGVLDGNLQMVTELYDRHAAFLYSTEYGMNMACFELHLSFSCSGKSKYQGLDSLQWVKV